MITASNTLPLFKSPEIVEDFDSAHDIVLKCGDTIEFLQTLPENIAKLIITSPPYNLGKEYESRIEIERYLEFQDQVIDQLVRVLRPDGSICWQVGNFVNDFEVFPLDILYYNHFKKHGLKLRNRIIWRFNHGLHASKRFSGRYETILWFSKSDDYTFNLDSSVCHLSILGSATSRDQTGACFLAIHWVRTRLIHGTLSPKNGTKSCGTFQTSKPTTRRKQTIPVNTQLNLLNVAFLL